MILQKLGQNTLFIIAYLGRMLVFLLRLLPASLMILFKLRLIIKQIYSAGVLSLPIIIMAGLAVGMVLGLQGYNTLVNFNAEESLGVMVALSLVRELGPVVSALLFAGRAGSALTAEIGLMQATEQLAAMEMMAVDPLKKIIAPRFIGAFISLPLLAALFSMVAILGGHLIGVELLGVDAGSYWSQMQKNVDFSEDIISGMIKSLVFGFIVAWIAVFEGYYAPPTAEGVGRATTRTVVHASLFILGLDFILTALMFVNVA